MPSTADLLPTYTRRRAAKSPSHVPTSSANHASMTNSVIRVRTSRRLTTLHGWLQAVQTAGAVPIMDMETSTATVLSTPMMFRWLIMPSWQEYPPRYRLIILGAMSTMMVLSTPTMFRTLITNSWLVYLNCPVRVRTAHDRDSGHLKYEKVNKSLCYQEGKLLCFQERRISKGSGRKMKENML